MNEENMKFWNSVCKTNPAETKTVEYPFKHTAIGAMFQIKHATEQWGMIGIAWGVKDEKFTPLMLDTEHKGFLFYSATLFYPGGEMPIHADINFYNRTKNGYQIENDITKKVATDALTKGLSKLGFNADVFEGLFDDNKYVQQMKKHFENQPSQKQKGDAKGAFVAIYNTKSIAELDKICSLINQRSWTEDELKELEQAVTVKRGDLQ